MKIKLKQIAFRRLKDLGPDMMSRIDSKLTSGESGMDVARWLQEDCNQLRDMKPSSLKKTIERYRGTELRNRTIKRIAEAQTGVPVKTLQKRLNAMDELEEMTRIQRGRVDKLHVHESGLPPGILLDKTTGEIRLLKDMLVDLGHIQMETGVLARAAKTFKGTLTDANGEVKQFEWSEEQEKLFQELEQHVHAAEDA